MNEVPKHIDNLVAELRRGTVALAVLNQLVHPQYGYSLVTILQEKGMDVEPGTLYPLLRRLEKQGFLTSIWDTDENRPRKYYVLSEEGKETKNQLNIEWKEIIRDLNKVLEG